MLLSSRNHKSHHLSGTALGHVPLLKSLLNYLKYLLPAGSKHLLQKLSFGACWFQESERSSKPYSQSKLEKEGCRNSCVQALCSHLLASLYSSYPMFQHGWLKDLDGILPCAFSHPSKQLCVCSQPQMCCERTAAGLWVAICCPPIVLVRNYLHCQCSCSPGLRAKPGFHSQLEKIYKMRPRALSGNSQLDLQEINTWVRQQTKGRIMRFMKDMPMDVSILLAGAAYLKGKNAGYLVTRTNL